MSIVGNIVGCYSLMGKTFIIEDTDGNSIPDSTKKFKITVDDSGTISATEVTT